MFIDDLDYISKNPDYEPITFDVDDDGCYLWNGALTSIGYSEVYDPSTHKVLYAHRVSLEHTDGSIPAGHKFNVHHQCRIKNCVNPSHLVLVSAKFHAAITCAAMPPRIRCRSKRHLWVPENVAVNKRGYRFCVLCRKESDANKKLSSDYITTKKLRNQKRHKKMMQRFKKDPVAYQAFKDRQNASARRRYAEKKLEEASLRAPSKV